MTLARMAVLVTAIAACAPSAAPPPARPTLRAFVRVELQVSNLEVGPPDRLEIDLDGSTRLVRVAGVPPVGIGFFESRLRPDELRALAHALQDLAASPDHHGRIVPDDRVRRVRVAWAGAPPVEKVVGTTEPVEPRLAAILQRLEGIERRVAQHPRQTVGLSLDGVATGPGRMLVAHVVVTATGTSAVEAPGLYALVGTPGALGLRLEAAGRTAEVPVVEVVGPEAPLLRLEPGASVRFDLLAPAPEGDAFERAEAVVRWDGGGGQVPIAGELRSGTAPIAPVAP